MTCAISPETSPEPFSSMVEEKTVTGSAIAEASMQVQMKICTACCSRVGPATDTRLLLWDVCEVIDHSRPFFGKIVQMHEPFIRDCSAYLLQVSGRTWHAKIMGLVCGPHDEVRRLSMISEPEHHHRCIMWDRFLRFTQFHPFVPSNFAYIYRVFIRNRTEISTIRFPPG